MNEPVICLVTIHGVGFEQSPTLDEHDKYTIIPGYADHLHEYLSVYMDETWLSDDPLRARKRRGEAGPIYVSSVWPANTRHREDGLKRLGTWDQTHFRDIDCTGAPLTNGKGRISHIALVYSELEGHTALPGAAIDVLGTSFVHMTRYASIVEMMRMAFTDTQPFWDPLLHIWNQKPQDPINHEPGQTTLPPSLKVRQELKKPAPQNDQGQQHPIHDMITVVRQLENDVAAYVCHNELRERVRNFVLDAFLRLAGRADVGGIIINSHSNGTVVALDILRDLPPFAARKVLGLITAGSPLRKYTNFFTWGEHMSTIPKIEKWVNFLDPKDPVADPLAPDSAWKRNTPKTGHMTGLYKALNPVNGDIDDMIIDDREVDNLKHSSGGGLQAHNYWDNQTQFVQPVAAILQELASKP